MKHLSDAKLIEQAKTGDKEAYKELFNRHNERILGFLYHYMGDYQAAEDVTIEAFMEVYKRLAAYEERGQFLSWVYKIAINIAKKEFRRKKKVKEVSLDTGEAEGRTVALGDLLGSGNESMPDYNIRIEELYRIVEDIMNSLGGKYRQALTLCDMQKVSLGEAADILNCSKWTLGMRLTRARRLLCRELRKRGYTISIAKNVEV